MNSVSGSRPPSPVRSVHEPHTGDTPTTPAASRPPNAKLSGDAIKQSFVDGGRFLSNAGASLGFATASGAQKLAAGLDKHSAGLSPQTQPKRYGGATKTAALLKIIASGSEKGARSLAKFSKPLDPPAPKR